MLSFVKNALMGGAANVNATSPAMLADGGWSELDTAREGLASGTARAYGASERYASAMNDTFGHRWCYLEATPDKELSEAEREIKAGVKQERAAFNAACTAHGVTEGAARKAWYDARQKQMEANGDIDTSKGAQDSKGKKSLVAFTQETMPKALRRWQNTEADDAPEWVHAFYDAVEEAYLEYAPDVTRDDLYPSKD